MKESELTDKIPTKPWGNFGLLRLDRTERVQF